MAPLAPGRGEGLGVRGEVPLEAAVQSHGCGVFFATDEHGLSRMNRRGFGCPRNTRKARKLAFDAKAFFVVV